jgi:predicted dehydrogenase
MEGEAMERSENGASRRDFLRTAVAAWTAGGLTILGANTARGQAKKTLKAALIGCGGRGSGAIRDCLNAAKHLGTAEIKVVALADAMKDRVDGAREGLRKEGHEIPEDRCFVGFDAYKKVMATDVDLVLLTETPVFRPSHYAAAVEAGKHVFMEKPVAVDPAGCRKMYATGEKAAQKKLSVVAGTCLRHAAGYAATHKVVAEDGAIGKIRGGVIWYCTGRLWARPRQEGWSDAEYMVRNWVNFAAMSGDHIVEQYIHTLDMLSWHMGATPVAAVGFGGRHRRKTGDQFDFFSNDLEYADKVHVHGCCRQISGCWSRANEGELAGEKGTCSFGNKGVVRDLERKPLPLPEYQWHGSMYVQEHVVLLDSILGEKAVNHTKEVTDSTLAAVMSRIAAYTGQRVTWDEMLKSDLALSPSEEDFEQGTVKAPPDDVVPVPGSQEKPPRPAPAAKKGRK